RAPRSAGARPSRDAALQYVRKISGSAHPAAANQAAFDRAVDAVALATSELLDSLTTTAPPRSREADAERAKERSRRRFGAE
ncbi:MAG: DUF2277 domain-containing protein, partial [Stackebrandtia sp.]